MLASVFFRREAEYVFEKNVLGHMSNSLPPCGPQPIRLLCPWDSPGKIAGVGCCFFLQGTFLTQILNPCLLCLLSWWKNRYCFSVLPWKLSNIYPSILSTNLERTWQKLYLQGFWIMLENNIFHSKFSKSKVVLYPNTTGIIHEACQHLFPLFPLRPLHLFGFHYYKKYFMGVKGKHIKPTYFWEQ